MTSKFPKLLLCLAVAAGFVARAQGAALGSAPPKLHGQTLNGKDIVLADAATGKVVLIIVGASKKGGERTGPWKDHFVADFGFNGQTTYFVTAMLQKVPSLFRGVIRSGMRGGTPDAERSHILTSATDEDAWKQYLEMKDDSIPSVLLLDESGHLRWSYSGIFDSDHYQALKAAAATLLDRRK